MNEKIILHSTFSLGAHSLSIRSKIWLTWDTFSIQVDQNLDCPHLEFCMLSRLKLATPYFCIDVCKWLKDAD